MNARKQVRVTKGKKDVKKPPRGMQRSQFDDGANEGELIQEYDDLNTEQNAANMIQISEQEQLTPEQKEELITKALTSNNPQAPHNITQYSYKDFTFKIDDLIEHLVVHFAVDGEVILKDTEEAREQEDYWMEKEDYNQRLIKQMNEGVTDENGDPIKQDAAALKKSLRNQFNFQERASQTFNLPIRQRGVSTEPPPIAVFSMETTQWKIFDAYMADFEATQKADEAESKNKVKEQPKKQAVKEDPLYSTSMKRVLRIIERMLVQNAEEEKFDDYKYYEDDTEDPEALNMGSVLPLWRFSTEKSKRKHVTAICWNPEYKDLFAVGYGSYDFLKQSTGLICIYTIKNPTWPEYTFTTESGVMCVDFHKQHPALLAVGLYDGTVMVFDIRNKSNKPIYQSTVRTKKHTDPVWQVNWQTEDVTKDLNFFSISSDGRVTNWVLMKNKLEPEEVLKLKLVADQDKELVENKKEAFLYGYAGGMCFDFNKANENLFLVGTEEGKIHLCSKAYSGQYLETYEGHYLAVYSVKWNNFHPRVFLSCSADWTIKMWDSNIKKPIMTFDLGCAVGDIEWAPYSSTVFATVTSSGHLYVYDLFYDKHSHLCDFQTLRRAKALHVAFNKTDPIILVGDDKGGVNSLILSKNLTRGPIQPPEDKPGKTPQDMEREKMENFLALQDKEMY